MSHEVELAALEADILKAAQIGDYLKRVAALRVLLAMASPNLVEEALKITAPKVEGVALGAVANAFGLGRDAALGLIDDEKTIARATRRALPSAAARAPVLGLDKAGAAAVASARALSRAGAEPATIVSPLLAHANTLQRSLTYAVNTAGNEGVLAVADTAEVPTVWIAETDACVDCLAYSGQVTDSGEQFPGGLTYGATSPFPDPLDAPPLHPNCRCTIEPSNDPSFSDALKREADRSVLRGFSLESERQSVRVDAAQRLLDKGVVAPKSVKVFARKSIAAGEFPTRNR